MLAIRTILHPTDFSDYSAFAFRLACSLARDYDARLVVLHVAEIPVAGGVDGMLILPPELDLEPLREKLRHLRPVDPKVRVEYLLVEGDTATEILHRGQELKCDLIVLGTHGRTGLARLLMGSVAERIVRNASCPVLTVKTPLSGALTSQEDSSEALLIPTAVGN